MVEIERKFLVDTKKWQASGKGIKIKQGYLSVDPERTVRVRRAGTHSYLTIKGKTVGISRIEMEYEIPENDAEELMNMCLKFPVEKTRYIEKRGDLKWEIDVFEGVNTGLILAEIELNDENQVIELPDWIESEVSGDSRFYNAALSINPFSTWKK